MAKFASRLTLFASLAFALAMALPAVAPAAPAWQKSAIPKSGTFEVALGQTADLECWSRNRCLLLTTGNASFANGLFVYNGQSWRQYATVCGPKTAANGRIVWAGPTEFWTITQPSTPQDGPANSGLALCRFKDGQVVGSYSTKIVGNGDDPTDDPFRSIGAGACITAANCWFGGGVSQSPDSSRVGSFHLHWNGSEIETVYAPSKRGVTDMARLGGGLVESLLAGPDRNLPPNPDFGDVPELRLIQNIDPAGASASAVTPDDFVPAVSPAAPGEVTELFAIDDDGAAGAEPQVAWTVGGGATSGPGATPEDPFDRGPFAARATSDGAWSEISLPDGMFAPDAHFIDVSAMPGGDDAMVAVLPDRRAGAMISGSATVARISPDGDVELQQFGFNGTIAALDCPVVDDCWAATENGWIYHYSDPATAAPPIDDSPAFTTSVTYRPNEVIEQAVSDLPPEDDSLLFAPPPAEPEAAQDAPKTVKLKPAIRRLRSKLRGNTLIFTFRVVRRARVEIVARRKRKVVARAKTGLLGKGRHTMKLRLNSKRWPTKLSMNIDEPGLVPPEDDDDTVSVPEGGVVESSLTAPAGGTYVRCAAIFGLEFCK